VHPSVLARVAILLPLAAAFAATPARASDRGFPFDKELRLDADPMRGSKRVPLLDIRADGTAEIDLWCNTAQGQLLVVGDTVTVLVGARTDRACPPERAQRDDDLLAALTGVTNWRRERDTLMLIGPRTLRYRLQTN
jgi:heat shock protein HslJ